ncbi:MAG: hypothetical protein JWR61_2414 [Ferruginibacter sp.]|uniref:DUF3500 domain-containing protein n=1 Tax=Ferruginibacter sp. TaxID=1940288 RepID=UPI002658D9D4|nr:DUF3500 domain-containing protein [Ferruginibacter sp.]MDB5277459.1 hypothetical protein [Ferruginibacter sp.]
MKHSLLLLTVLFIFITTTSAQDLAGKANAFINMLEAAQRTKALYPFDTTERYRFHYVPQDDRKGISFNELTPAQREAAIALLKTCLTDETVKKVREIMLLDNVLKELENRKPEDHFRDPLKYFVTIFGVPAAGNIWGWRLEGHHVSFHFSASNNKLVAATPTFMGDNPAIVLSGDQKGKEVLKEETDKGFALVQNLSQEELKKAIIDTIVPADIVTANNRQAMIKNPAGIRYSELSAASKQRMLQLLNLYVHRYTTLFADAMLKEIQTAGLDNLWFTWVGYTDHAFGKPCYYRIQGPTIIIEYDNTQNNANHIHTVVRDLKTDFGGDPLLEHYRQSH